VNLLTLSTGGGWLAFSEEQVRAVHVCRPEDSAAEDLLGRLGVPVGPLPEWHVLELSGVAPTRRWSVPARPSRAELAAERLVRVPPLLRRLRGPRWLAGFAQLESDALALLVDLRRLEPAAGERKDG
jgi:hypothetical protein